MISRRSFVLPGVALLLPIAGCVNVSGADSRWLTERDEKRFSTEGKPEVVLSTFDGSIEVRSWDRADVLVVIEKRFSSASEAGAIQVESSQDGNRVSVEVKHPSSRQMYWSWFGPGSARLIVSVPKSADVRASSGDGSIRLDNVDGVITLRSGDGRIHAANISGNVSVSTGDGPIDLDQVDGEIVATTGDGRIRAGGKLTSVRAHSGDGGIAIRAEAGSAAEADWDITSGDGSVTLQIPDGFNADLDARTGDGGIHMSGVNLTSSGLITRSTLTGRLGSGGKSLRVRTGDGRITLRRQ